jgi:hypothetical protein
LDTTLPVTVVTDESGTSVATWFCFESGTMPQYTNTAQQSAATQMLCLLITSKILLQDISLSTGHFRTLSGEKIDKIAK